MSFPYRATTLEVLEAFGMPATPVRDASFERYRVYEVCTKFGNETYNRLGPEAFAAGPWPATPRQIAALRAALDAQPDDYVAHQLAVTLLRVGCCESGIVARLSPTDRFAFHWKEDGLDSRQVDQLVRAAGFDPIAPKGAGKIDAWISDPVHAHGRWLDLTNVLFGNHLVYGSLQSNDFCPRHDELLVALAKGARPALLIEGATQRVDKERFHDAGTIQGVPVISDQGAFWIVEFRHEGRPHRFRARCNGSWLDLEPVLAHFNAVLESMGRADRAFDLDLGGGQGADWGLFIVAPARRFQQLMNRLHLPLRPMCIRDGSVLS